MSMDPDGVEIGLDHPWHQQMHPELPGDSGWLRWKKNGSGFNMTRQLWAARARALSDLASGSWPGGSWPTKHIPVVVWMPWAARAACLGCIWLGSALADVDDAATAAILHSLEFAGDQPPLYRLRRVPVYARNGPDDPPAAAWGWPKR